MKNKRVQKLSEQKLLQYGCSKEGMTYRCIQKLKAPNFYAVITYERQELHVEVYDAQLKEPYTPFHVPMANGSFVSSIREEVEELLENMVQQCADGNPYRSLGIDADGMTDVCNLKNRPECIQELIDYKRFYPAYHMNKTYWFTILLDQELSWKQLQELIDESYQLVSAAK